MIVVQPVAAPVAKACSNGRTCRFIGIVLALVWVAMITTPPNADAATYTVWACANGSGGRLGTGDWRPHRVEGEQHRAEGCDHVVEGRAPFLFASAEPAPLNRPSGSGVGWTATAAGGTTLRSLDLWWNNCVVGQYGATGRIQVYAGADSIYSRDSHGCWGVTGLAVEGPSPQGNHQTFGGLNSSTMTLVAWCLSLCDGSSGARLWAADFYAYRLKVTVHDPAPPTGTVHGLVDGMRIGGMVPLHVQADDAGGGVREVSLRVDGRVVQRDVSAGDCADVDSGNGDAHEYNRMQPCPRQRSAGLILAPADFADGRRHVVNVIVTDAAGQETVISTARVALRSPSGYVTGSQFFNPDLDVVGDRNVNGANGGPAVLRLSFVVRKGKRRRFVARRVVRANDRPLVSGRLISALGAPIAGARVWLATALSNGSWQVSGRSTNTSTTGHVSGRLPPRTPTRDVRLVYFPYSDSSENVQSPSRRLTVRAATTIRTDQAGYSNGDTVRFSGRVTTVPVARRKSVYLQVIVRGRWRTFATTRANSRGRWTLGYRFTATRQLTVYRFRAVIPAEEHPVSWATGHSRAVRVLVAP